MKKTFWYYVVVTPLYGHFLHKDRFYLADTEKRGAS